MKKLAWLDTYLGERMLDEITLDVIDNIRAAKLKEATKATTNRYLAVVRAILRRACDVWEWIDKAPKIVLFKEAASRERSLTWEQAKRVLDELPEHQREVVLFASATGLRQSNVLKLEWARVNLESRHAWIPGWQSKNRRAISVSLNDQAIGVLQRQFGKHPERVFTYAGRPLSTANTRAWRAALKRAGVDDFRWHDLRHTWATWQMEAGTPTHELQRLGGWRTGAMVDRYAHLGPGHLAVAANRLNATMVGYDPATRVKKKKGCIAATL
ncbi:MAG TPA: site-specific integrase [Burkholderiaceae bacterium]